MKAEFYVKETGMVLVLTELDLFDELILRDQPTVTMVEEWGQVKACIPMLTPSMAVIEVPTVSEGEPIVF